MTDPRFEGVPLRRPDFADDDGAADSALVDALARFGRGDGDRAEVHEALRTARLLVPVVAVLDEAEVDESGLTHEKSSSMATVSVVGAGGRRAMLAFTSVDSMRLWDPAARPMPAFGPQVCAAALDQGDDAVLLDYAGPVRLAVSDDALATLASLTTRD